MAIGRDVILKSELMSLLQNLQAVLNKLFANYK